MISRDWQDGYITVDWGTTNRRAYLVASDATVIDEFEDDQGVLAASASGFEASVAGIRGRLGDHPMLLVGMIGSNRGWHEARYVAAPASLKAVSDAVLWVDPRTGIVPGVSVVDDGRGDVMRGEEVQALGASAAGLIEPDGVICHPGTHAKWMTLAGGAISGFQTVMTGELFALLRRDSILAPQLAGEVAASAAFVQGVRDGLAGDLTAKLFGVRGRALLDLPERDEASWTSGLLIGADIGFGLKLAGGRSIAVLGRPELTRLYAVALALAGRDATEIDGATALLAGVRAIVEAL